MLRVVMREKAASTSLFVSQKGDLLSSKTNSSHTRSKWVVLVQQQIWAIKKRKETVGIKMQNHANN